MDTRKAATEYRMSQWSERLRERAASGESIAKFCVNRGIRRNQYFYWQRKLREAACTQLAIREKEPIKEPIPNGWARLMPAQSCRPSGEVKIEVGGFFVMVTDETDLELLSKVCRTLKALC